MSKKKNAPLPASSAGLLRFFEDETKGIKIKPELVLGIAGGIIGVSILIRIIFPVWRHFSCSDRAKIVYQIYIKDGR
jgi:preprotein translocase subunit Sec61beta